MYQLNNPPAIAAVANANNTGLRPNKLSATPAKAKAKIKSDLQEKISKTKVEKSWTGLIDEIIC